QPSPAAEHACRTAAAQASREAGRAAEVGISSATGAGIAEPRIRQRKKAAESSCASERGQRWTQGAVARRAGSSKMAAPRFERPDRTLILKLSFAAGPERVMDT